MRINTSQACPCEVAETQGDTVGLSVCLGEHSAIPTDAEDYESPHGRQKAAAVLLAELATKGQLVFVTVDALGPSDR